MQNPNSLVAKIQALFRGYCIRKLVSTYQLDYARMARHIEMEVKHYSPEYTSPSIGGFRIRDQIGALTVFSNWGAIQQSNVDKLDFEDNPLYNYLLDEASWLEYAISERIHVSFW